MKTNLLARYLVNQLRIVKDKFTVLSVQGNTMKRIAKTSNTASLKVLRTSGTILLGPLTLSRPETITIEGMIEEGAMIATMIDTTTQTTIRTTTRTTQDTAKVITTKTDRVTTTEIKVSPKWILSLPNTNLGAKMWKSIPTLPQQEATRNRGEAMIELVAAIILDRIWTTDTRATLRATTIIRDPIITTKEVNIMNVSQTILTHML